MNSQYPTSSRDRRAGGSLLLGLCGQRSVAGTLSGVALFLFTFHFAMAAVHAQSGGTCDVSHSVIASGGGSNSIGATFNVGGTVGQPIAGTSSNGDGRFDLHGGFWFQDLAPTAAAVSISGRVTTGVGMGILGARLTLTAPDGAIRTAITSTFGYYAFDGIEIGHTYTLEINSKRHTFVNPTRVFSLQDQITDMDFTAQD